MKTMFIDVEALSAEGWQLMRTVDTGSTYETEFKKLEEIPAVEPITALIEHALELNAAIIITDAEHSICIEKREESSCASTETTT